MANISGEKGNFAPKSKIDFLRGAHLSFFYLFLTFNFNENKEKR